MEATHILIHFQLSFLIRGSYVKVFRKELANDMVIRWSEVFCSVLSDDFEQRLKGDR